MKGIAIAVLLVCFFVLGYAGASLRRLYKVGKELDKLVPGNKTFREKLTIIQTFNYLI